jgi:hypothetical protein
VRIRLRKSPCDLTDLLAEARAERFEVWLQRVIDELLEPARHLD